MSLPNSEILEYLTRLETEVKKFKTDLFRIGWSMRGSVSVQDLLLVYSYEDREMMATIINENIENTINSGIPLV